MRVKKSDMRALRRTSLTTTKVEVRLLKLIRAFKASIGKFKEVMFDVDDDG